MDDYLNDAFDYIDDRHIRDAAACKKRHPVGIILGAVAAVLAAVIAWTAIWSELDWKPKPPILLLPTTTTQAQPDPQPTASPVPSTVPSEPTIQPTTEPVTTPAPPDIVTLAHQVGEPEYPDYPQMPRYSDFARHDDYLQAQAAFRKAMSQIPTPPAGYADSLDTFFRDSIPVLLKGEGNRACSPLNIYLALAMMAETAGGETRQQVLDLLGADSIEALRSQAQQVWNAHYRDDGQTTSLLAASVWMDEGCAFRKDTIQTLAQDYHAAAFHGDLGSEEINEELRTWLDRNTGSLLSQYTRDITLDPETLFALAATAYFRADWETPFYKDFTEEGLFFCNYDSAEVMFMYTILPNSVYYRGKNFGAVRLELSGGNQMWIILPDEGIAVEKVLAGDEYWHLLRDPESCTNTTEARILLHLPRFDISSKTDLIPSLKALGITHAFDRDTSDFSALMDSPRVVISEASHAARVAVDEDGITAAAYTFMTYEPTGAPEPPDEVEFTVNRPFFFAVTSGDNLPMFTGIVEQP